MPPAQSPTTTVRDPSLYEIGLPYDLKHDLHIHYNFTEARFEGVPDNFFNYLALNSAPTKVPKRKGILLSNRSSGSATTRGSMSNNLSHCSKQRNKRGRNRTGSDSSSGSDVDYSDPHLLLNQHFQLHFRHVPRLHVKGYGERIPAILVMLQHHFMAKQGYLTPHIFRESPNKAERDQAMYEINRGSFCGASHDVRVLADLIKVWFRELPVPILHEIAPDQMEKLAKTVDIMEELQNQLGSLEFNVIMWLADMLSDVAQHQDKNHMGLDQLAIVIAPNLIRVETVNPMVAVTLSKASVDLFRRVLRARASEIRERTHVAVAPEPTTTSV